MTSFQFSAPPLPYFLACGEDTYQPGQKHPARQKLGVFDLLLVTAGCLHMGEEAQTWEVHAGHTLILRPDAHHYAVRGCEETTHFYWLHFQIPEAGGGIDASVEFVLDIPRLADLMQPLTAWGFMRDLIELDKQPNAAARWQQQLVFQQLLLQLSRERGQRQDSQAYRLAEQAATYLRAHYREEITYEKLGATLQYNPVYVARCMKMAFNCTPQDYLLRYRLEQAKQLLLNTDTAIGRIAEEVGLPHFSYFSRLFLRQEGITPRMFRSRYHV